jgi:hypothetical protein
VAPTPRRPASTTANELVNPTIAVRMPASTGRPGGSGGVSGPEGGDGVFVAGGEPGWAAGVPGWAGSP